MKTQTAFRIASEDHNYKQPTCNDQTTIQVLEDNVRKQVKTLYIYTVNQTHSCLYLISTRV